MESQNIRRNLILVACTCCLVILTSGCENPLGPDTATITFENHAQHATFDVVLDGARIGSIAPGQEIERDVAAGSHSVAFKFANTNQQACSTATPNLAAGEHTILSCSSDLNKDCGCEE